MKIEKLINCNAHSIPNSKGRKTDRVLFSGCFDNSTNYISVVKVSNYFFLRMLSKIIFIFTHSLIEVEVADNSNQRQWILVNNNSLKKRLGCDSIQQLIEVVNSTALHKIFCVASPLIKQDPSFSIFSIQALKKETALQMSRKKGNLFFSEATACRDVLVVDGRSYMLLNKPGDTEIGKGKFKVVYYAIDLETGEKKAVSVLTKENLTVLGKQTLVQEPLMMKQAQERKSNFLVGSPGFVEIESENKYTIMTLMEYYKGCSLRDLFSKELGLSVRKRMAEEILEGVLELEKLNYLHRDVKPENIFIKTEAGGDSHALIGDFGTAHLKGSNMLVYAADMQYAPPIIIKKIKEDSMKESEIEQEIFHMDEWSVGLVLFEIFHPKHQQFWTLCSEEKSLVEACETGILSCKSLIEKLQKQKIQDPDKIRESQGVIENFQKEKEEALQEISRKISSELSGIPVSIITAIQGLLETDCQKRMSIENALSLFKQAL